MQITSNSYSSFQNFIVWENGFTPGELSAIEALGDGLQLQKANLHYEDDESRTDGAIRAGSTAWLNPGPENKWLYDKLQQIVWTLNDQVFHYELVGFSDPLQYTVYDSESADHFSWHVDQKEAKFPRKLSFSLQLTNPAGYEGCDLEIFHGSREPVAAPRERGLLIIFPSYVMHRVTPIRAGRRKALVFWAAGPHFR